MAAVSVFVDDAIRGDLPLMCAKTGEPADLKIRMRQPVGMFPLLWLAAGAAFFVAAGAFTWMLWRQSISVSIDVTRRWVTFTGVHPAFVEAVQRQEATPGRR